MYSSLTPSGFRRQFTVTAALAACIALACDSPGGPDPATIPVELRLSMDSVRVFEGSSVQLTSTYLNGDGAIIDPALEEWPTTWHSSNESVAVVVDGLVTGLSPGESVITASSGELSDQATVDVRAVPTAEDLVLAMDISPDTLGSGGSFVIHYSITNTARDTAILTTQSTCLADSHATRDSQDIAFGGWCTPLGYDWPIAPGATSEITIHHVAAIVPDWIPADPGVYTVTLESNVIEINGRQAYLPTLDGEVILVPAPTLEDLTFAMSLEPDTVAPGESFMLSYSITNMASVQVILRFPSSCIYLAPQVYRGDERVYLAGTMHGCRCMFTDWEIAPGATLTGSLGASATILIPPPDLSEQGPAEPGSYTIVWPPESPMWINRYPAEIPTLSDTLTVAG
jgi:hypothetical protein